MDPILGLKILDLKKIEKIRTHSSVERLKKAKVGENMKEIDDINLITLLVSIEEIFRYFCDSLIKKQLTLYELQVLADNLNRYTETLNKHIGRKISRKKEV